MSWDSYVSDQLIGTGNVKEAAIIGLEGSVWASSEGLKSLTPAEITALIKGFSSADALRAGGLHIGGTKYLLLRADEDAIYAKKKQCGLCAVKTVKAIVLAVYDDNIQPGKCNDTCGKLADYLKTSGY